MKRASPSLCPRKGCENKDRDEIVQMINVHAHGLALRRAVRVANHFKLTIENEASAKLWPSPSLRSLILDIPDGETVAFGDEFALRSICEWFAGSEMLTRLSYVNQQPASSATCALISDYDAKSIGEPDASAPPDQPRSMQNRKFESILFGNFALWLAQPSRACFSVVCHGLHCDIPGKQSSRSFSKSNGKPPCTDIPTTRTNACHWIRSETPEYCTEP